MDKRRSDNSGRFLSLAIETPKGEVHVSLFPEAQNPMARRITQQNVKTILQAYEVPPQGQFDYFLDIAPLLTGLPVTVYVSNRNDKTNVYFREVHKKVKVKREAGRIVERVEF